MLSNALSGYQTLNMVFKTYQSKGSQREKNSEFGFRTCQSVKTILIIPRRDWFHVQAHMYVIPRIYMDIYSPIDTKSQSTCKKVLDDETPKLHMLAITP